ncbi:MAG: 2-keto-4-pentenoate hydratase [Rhodospirillaceae bacterium]|jgi:2-keto-4-pentenoate hydratase|nr:2-keto-4-pentenoate hydratase [Rhodospirillaceae bacterium]
MSDDAIQKAADWLHEAYQSGVGCEPVRDLLPEGDVDAAYAVQEINTERRLASGARMVGRKIGLTSKLVQKQLGVDRPDFGILFADMSVPDGEEVDTSTLLAPRVEAEISYVLEKDIIFEKPTNSEVIDAIAYATPSIEIVDSRIKDWNIKIQDTVADNASAVLYVLGNQKVKIEDFDGRMCGMVMECKGQPVSVGAGAACLGHPINAVRWLAEEMVNRGRPLSAGDVVMSGALGPMVGVEAGQVYEVRINGLGSVRAAFAA